MVGILFRRVEMLVVGFPMAIEQLTRTEAPWWLQIRQTIEVWFSVENGFSIGHFLSHSQQIVPAVR